MPDFSRGTNQRGAVGHGIRWNVAAVLFLGIFLLVSNYQYENQVLRQRRRTIVFGTTTTSAAFDTQGRHEDVGATGQDPDNSMMKAPVISFLLPNSKGSNSEASASNAQCADSTQTSRYLKLMLNKHNSLQNHTKDMSLALSIQQQRSFDSKKGRLSEIFPKERLFPTNLADWGANIVNEEYAYLHIYKVSGGRSLIISSRTL